MKYKITKVAFTYNGTYCVCAGYLTWDMFKGGSLTIYAARPLVKSFSFLHESIERSVPARLWLKRGVYGIIPRLLFMGADFNLMLNGNADVKVNEVFFIKIGGRKNTEYNISGKSLYCTDKNIWFPMYDNGFINDKAICYQYNYQSDNLKLKIDKQNNTVKCEWQIDNRVYTQKEIKRFAVAVEIALSLYFGHTIRLIFNEIYSHKTSKEYIKPRELKSLFCNIIDKNEMAEYDLTKIIFALMKNDKKQK